MTRIIQTGLSLLTWQPGSLPLYQICLSISLWSSLYFLARQVWYERSAEYCCRLITLLHGLIVTTISALLHFYLGPAPWKYFGHENSPAHNFVLLLSLGYFLFDFAWCCYMGSEGIAMLTHHLVSLIGLSYAVVLHRYGSEVTAVCFGAEITNPILQFRWFLREHNQYHTIVGVINDYLFVFSFAFWRFGIGSYFLYEALWTDKVDWMIKAGGSSLYLISIVFMYSIGKFFLRKYVWKMKKKNE